MERVARKQKVEILISDGFNRDMVFLLKAWTAFGTARKSWRKGSFKFETFGETAAEETLVV